jgi:deoxyribonuclease IV
MEKKVLVGAHTSIAKGVYNALYQGEKLQATTIQIFTSNQRQWKAKLLTDDIIEKFLSAKKQTGISTIVSHTNYLINLGASKKNVLNISKKAFEEEIIRCHQLKIDYLVFHPGSFIGSTEEACLDTIVESLLSFSKLTKKGTTRLLLEITAGQGTNIGYKFEHLDYIIKKVKDNIPIGVCFDTCHVFSAGYDIRTHKDFEKTIEEFDKIIGINYLFAFHLNDSKNELGSRKDRHENLGKGKIGLECFEFIMKEKKFINMPKILETPDENLWEKEIELLKKFAG